MKSLKTLAAAAVLSVAGMSAPALADVKIGTLVCDVSGGIGLIIGSSKSVRCTFNRADGGAEYYSGSINKYGLDIGVTKSATMAWVVLAPGLPGPGALGGSYGGATAEATVGVGAGANVLVGGLDRSIALQPLSVQAQTGLNVAAGVASLTLRSQ